MRQEKILGHILRNIANLISEESARNPLFAEQVKTILSEIPQKAQQQKKSPPDVPFDQLPDIHWEWKSKGETDFRLWLNDQPLSVLRAIVRQQDFDPTYKTKRWNEASKLTVFIVDALKARLQKGSAFIGKSEKVYPDEP